MKKPNRTEPIHVTTRQPKWIGGSGPDCEFRASIQGHKIKSASVCGMSYAITNAALKFYFGGTAPRFAGKEERAAIRIRKLAANRYRVDLKN